MEPERLVLGVLDTTTLVHFPEIGDRPLLSLDMPADPYIAKLKVRNSLSAEDVAAFRSLSSETTSYSPNELVQLDGGNVLKVGFILSGFVSSFKKVQFDKMQITGFLLPGDGLDVASVLTNQPNTNALAHVRSEICWVPSKDLRDLCFARPNIATALWLDTLIDAGIVREWVANIGQRNASQRIAHLLLEMAARSEASSGVGNATFELPVSQSHLASALGLSLVHFNKSLRSLERVGWVSKIGRIFTLPRKVALEEYVGFDPGYLWLGATRAIDRNSGSPQIGHESRRFQ